MTNAEHEKQKQYAEAIYAKILEAITPALRDDDISTKTVASTVAIMFVAMCQGHGLTADQAVEVVRTIYAAIKAGGSSMPLPDAGFFKPN